MLENWLVLLESYVCNTQKNNKRGANKSKRLIETTYLLDEFDDLEDGLSVCMTEAGLCIAAVVFGISIAVKPKLKPPPLCKSTVSPELLTSNCSEAEFNSNG